jgi:hypothetical protein
MQDAGLWIGLIVGMLLVFILDAAERAAEHPRRPGGRAGPL